MKVALINFAMGNLASVRRGLEDLGVDVIIANTPDALLHVDKIVLPGVGAFYQGMANLHAGGWLPALNEAVIEQRIPILGICLGMQMLASHGEEGGSTTGLGFIPGRVKNLDHLGCKLRLPHIGWNDISYPAASVIFDDIQSGTDFYFVHSYAFVPEQEAFISAYVSYDVKVVAAIQNEHIFGCQFHPEKSSRAGRKVLQNFLNYTHA
ncbi:MAG: imidazole glycerol phosphate synthase subunit HisH [Methyloprofundus sp.]|nr:imidazole glycerol phosphate synthase subunit HisH [Methyloprofundus sp.]MDT8425211.1 imidazole glycerol phosphate synthase subunit HisH [Methyloprofundus sp.]